MFVRNFVTAGSLLEPVPVGLRLTLQYDVEGHIEKVFEGFNAYGEDLSLLLLESFFNQKLVPPTISVKNGTTHVMGVLYCKKFVKGHGNLPSSLVNEYIQEFLNRPEDFTFYAGNMTSLATTFHGAVPIRRWLQLAGFQVLPGYVIPAGLKEAKFEKLIRTAQFKFVYPLITDYIIFDKVGCNYYNLDFVQHEIKRVTKYVDDDGNIRCKVKVKDSDEDFDFALSDVTRLNIASGSFIILDEEKKLLYSSTYPNPNKNVTYTCPYCGKVYKVPTFGDTHCEDKHCVSRKYRSVTNFLKILGLPTMTRSRYDKMVKGREANFTVSDVLYEDDYKTYRVSTSLAKVMEAVVYTPKSKIDFETFCNRCNNIRQSIEYYLHNPDRILKDLGLESKANMFKNFIVWLKDPINVLDLESAFSNEHIQLVNQDVTIPNAAPIFRGCKVYVTGNFIRGDATRIASILKSYGAEILDVYDNKASFVLVGSMHEREDGKAIRSAKLNNVRIFEENDFFTRYEIDQDIAQNL